MNLTKFYWVFDRKYSLNCNHFNRLEKALLQPVTRTSTGKLPAARSNTETPVQNRTNVATKVVSTASPLANSKQLSIGHKASAEEIKEKMEQELRAQRAEHHKKRTLEMMQQKKGKRKIIQHFPVPLYSLKVIHSKLKLKSVSSK